MLPCIISALLIVMLMYVKVMAMMKVQGSWNQLPMWAEQSRQRCTAACGTVCTSHAV